MQDKEQKRSEMLEEFVSGYMEKLFYFCLKKTGGQTEAEDLTQEIALQIVSSLNRGILPENFPAWVWQIARNRYARWAKRKHDRAEAVSGTEIGDLEIEDGSAPILDEMIRKEELALLRRELAFIRGDYRSIVSAYYLEDKNVREISSLLSLPVNTVKSRLLRARNLLKEGMNMAREFGKRSYQPEEVRFVSSGSQPSGLPWSAVGRKIPKNILLQASGNPSTAQELSIELGISLPYMEEEIRLLHDATLLEKQGDKYVTNFFILDRDCRTDIYNALLQGAEERCRLLRAFIEDRLPDLRSLGIAGKSVSDNAIRWWLVPYLIDLLIAEAVKAHGEFDPPKRSNGEEWGFVGYELTPLLDQPVLCHNGSGDGKKNQFWAYSYGEYKTGAGVSLSYTDTVATCSLFRKYLRGESLSDFERAMVEAHKEDDELLFHYEGGYIVPDTVVLTEETQKRITEMFRLHPGFPALSRNAADAYAALAAIFGRYTNPVLDHTLCFNIRMELYDMRMMAIRALVGDGFLTLPEDPDHSTIGMYFIVD